ncbi:MAG: AAA family ATPase [Nocardioides sp.]
MGPTRAATVPDGAGPTRDHAAPVVGREVERGTIEQLVDGARGGLAGVLVVHGEPGIGKTCLLDAVASTTAGFDTVRLVGIESEMRLGFAALHQLLGPFLSRVDELPGPQARSLQATFGRSEDATPDRFLLGLAALTLVSTVAATGPPLLILVDDTQWLDDDSADVIGFLARRLHADRVCMIVSTRDAIDGRHPFAGLPAISLGPLSKSDAVALLETAVPVPLADHVRARVLADARGNPLALLEFGRELSADQRAGVVPLPEPLTIGRRLEQRFRRQLADLPAPSQRLLLVAASDPTGDPASILRAGRQLDYDEEAILPAQRAGLLEPGPRVAFRHPLIRSAVYQGADDAARRRAHEALAGATDAHGDPDLRVWHRAAAAQSTDEEIADELERAARRAAAQGRRAAEAALLARAAQLTADRQLRATRLLRAAAAELNAGNAARAGAHLALAEPDLRGPTLGARAMQLGATIAFVDSSPGASRPTPAGRGGGEVASMMLQAARAFAGLDVRRARDAAFDALQLAVLYGRSSAVSAAEVAQVADSLRLPAGAVPTAPDLVLDAIARLFADGFEAAAPQLHDALAAVRRDPRTDRSAREVARACWVAFALSDDELLSQLATTSAISSRERGASRVLPEAIDYLGLRELRVGSLDQAEDLFTEEIEMDGVLRRRTGPGEAARLIVSAWRGRDHEVRSGTAQLATDAQHVGLVVTWTDHALVLLELGLGNYAAASALAGDGWAADVMLGGLRAADAVEARVRNDERSVALVALDHLTERAAATRSLLDRGLLARATGLMVTDPGADDHFRASITDLDSCGAELQLARTQLVYGEWLRRQKRRRDAREQLAGARDTFEAMGATAFGDRARIELLATGARARRRVDDTRHDLTPQEWQIARLAAGGASNPEIAARLFISANTVDYHLRKVFRKLDITSRHAIAGRLARD